MPWEISVALAGAALLALSAVAAVTVLQLRQTSRRVAELSGSTSTAAEPPIVSSFDVRSSTKPAPIESVARPPTPVRLSAAPNALS